MEKILQKIAMFFVSIFLFSEKVFAAIIDPDIVPQQTVYGPPVYWTRPKILVFIIIPALIIISIILGVVIYIKRKRKNV